MLGGMSGDTSRERKSAGDTARLMNAASMLLIGCAVFIVLFAATPALVRAGLSRAQSASAARGSEHLLPHRPNPHAITSPPRPRAVIPSDPFDRGDDGPVGDIDSPPTSPRIPDFGAEDMGGEPRRSADDRRQEGDRREPTKMGLTRKAISLRDVPREGGVLLGEVSAGEQVVIFRASGSWLLILHNGNMGWAPASEIAVR